MQTVTKGSIMKKIIIAALAAAMTLVFVIYCAAAGGEITVGGASAKAGETVELTASTIRVSAISAHGRNTMKTRLNSYRRKPAWSTPIR